MTVKDINELSKEELAQQYMRMRSMLDEQTKAVIDFKKTVHQLQEENNQLKSNKKELQVNLKDLELKLQIAQEQLKKLIAAKYQSQRNQVVLDMPTLFDDVEAEVIKIEEAEIEETITVGEHKRIRKPKEKHIEYRLLPKEEVILRIPEEEKICEVCGSTMKLKKYETKEELVYEPYKLYIRVTKIPVLECENCQSINEEGKSSYHTVNHAFLYPKSLCSAELLAYIIDMKYSNGLPLYTLEKMFQKQGILLPRQNLCNWILNSAKYLEPLYELMKKDLLALPVIHCDETVTQVLKEEGKPATTTSYMWVYRSGISDKPIVLYEYRDTRAGRCPKEFLSGFHGYLGTDAYDGYNQVEGVTRFLCNVHALRKFKDAYKLLPKGKERVSSDEAEAIRRYDELFHRSHQIEAKAREKYKDPIKRNQYITERRQRELKPMFEAFFAWLEEIQPRNRGRYSMSAAIQYTLNHKEGLMRCTEDGRLALDNSICERSIRPFVVIRNRCKFSVSTTGAAVSALLYSIVISCTENRRNPYMYFTYLFEELPKLNLSDEAALRRLLPYSDQLPDYTRTYSQQEIRAILKEQPDVL